jgi:biopolymer transport protein ExbB
MMPELLIHTFFDFFSDGGMLMWPIFFVSIIAWMLGVRKLAFLNQFNRFRKKYILHLKHIISKRNVSINTGFTPYDDLLTGIKSNLECPENKCDIKLLFREFLISSIPEIEKGFSSMSVWITIAPLLGLLGTVTGMVYTFQIITDYGLGNPGLTAEGISIALLTTQAGLTASFPMMLFQNFLSNKSRTLKTRLLLDGETLVNHLNSNSAAVQIIKTGNNNV